MYVTSKIKLNKSDVDDHISCFRFAPNGDREMSVSVAFSFSVCCYSSMEICANCNGKRAQRTVRTYRHVYWKRASKATEMKRKPHKRKVQFLRRMASSPSIVITLIVVVPVMNSLNYEHKKHSAIDLYHLHRFYKRTALSKRCNRSWNH